MKRGTKITESSLNRLKEYSKKNIIFKIQESLQNFFIMNFVEKIKSLDLHLQII